MDLSTDVIRVSKYKGMKPETIPEHANQSLSEILFCHGVKKQRVPLSCP